MYSLITLGWIVVLIRFSYCSYKYFRSPQAKYERNIKFQIDILITLCLAVPMLFFTIFYIDPKI